MDIIHLGQGLRWQHWLTVVKRQPRAQTSAIVTQKSSPAGSSEIFEGDTAIPVYDSLEAALAEVPGQLAVVTGEDSVQLASAALESGLWVILDELGVIGREDARALLALSQSSQRPLLVPRRYLYAACERTVGRLLSMAGAIGHVSCSDSQPLPEGAGDAYRQAQLSIATVSHFDSLARLFGAKPVGVMARLASSRAGAPGTEAFLELESGLHVQYVGSLRPGPREHTLWIEAMAGSVKTDGSRVWWRKRGWPVFVPVRLWPWPVHSEAADDVALLAQAAAGIQRPADWPAQTHRDLLASIAATVESAHGGQPVRVADVETGAVD